MCINYGSCYESYCDSCNKQGRRAVEGLVGDDGKLLFPRSSYAAHKIERTPEQEAASKDFFEKMLIRTQLAGDIYRNKLQRLNENKKEYA